MGTLVSRRSPLVVFAAALLSGCSFVYDFDRFYPADAAPGFDGDVDSSIVDAGSELGTDGAPSDLGVDADASTGLTREQFRARFGELFCAKTLRCGDKLGIAVLLQELCHPAVAERFAPFFFGAFDGARYDAGAAQRCLDSLDTIDCSVSTDFTADCAVELRGDAAVGADCVGDLDCASGACEPRELACGQGCVATLGDSAACASNSDCALDLRCRGGTCRSVGVLTDVCDESQDCAAGYWCAVGVNRCAVLPDEGEACEIGFGGDPCRGSLVCTRSSGFAGQCRVGGAAGDACTFERPCQPGLRCSVSSQCVPLVAAGGTCASAQNCPPQHACIAEVCTPHGVVGETCSPTLPCAEGNCARGTCVLEPNGAAGCDRGGSLFALDVCAGFCDRTAADGPTCTARRVDGERCEEDVECAAGLECTGAAGVSTCAPCPAP